MKKTTPFKAAAEFEKELVDFANKYKLTLANHSKRISDYFEMSCYNLILRYYEKRGYSLEVKNLIKGDFKFKCSPNGFLDNFSYFKASKIEEDGQEDVVYLFHNATVQSAFDDRVFTTPDIVVAKTDVPDITTDHYITKLKLTYISNGNLVTFCEAKHIVPFSELMINFIGTLHELKPECTRGEERYEETDHLAPSMMISGTFSKPTKRIQESFEKRYYVNYFDNLFDDASMRLFYSKSQINKIATLGKKRERDQSSSSQSLPDDLKAILDTI